MDRVIRLAAFWQRGDQENAANRALTMALRTASFYRQISNGKWDYQAYGCAMPEEYWSINTNAPHYGVKAMRETWAMLLERQDLWPIGRDKKPIPPPFKDPTHWHMLARGYFPGQCGQANLRGTVGRTNVGMGCGLSTMAHEKGHNYGWGHANVRLKEATHRWPEGFIEEYKDRTSVMGSNAPICLDAPLIDYAGITDSDESTQITKNALIHIVPWEVPRRVRHDDEWAICNIFNNRKFPDSSTIDEDPYSWRGNSRIYVSTRKVKGFPWRVNAKEQRVYVHILSGVASIRIDVLEIGETCDVIPGVSITYEMLQGEAAVVSIAFDGDNTPTKRLSFSHFETFPPAPGVFPEQGVYFNENMKGQGIDLQRHEDGSFWLFWYTFNDQGDPEWRVAEFRNGETEAKIFMRDRIGGEVISDGTVRLLTHEGVTRLDWSSYTYGLGSTELTRLTATEDGVSGIWWNPERDGEGFSMRQIGKRVVGWFYTYDEDAPERAWFHFDGSFEELRMYRGIGKFNAYNLGEKFIGKDPIPAVIQEEGEALAFYWGDFSTKLERAK